MSVQFSISEVSSNMNKDDCYHYYAEHWNQPDRIEEIADRLLKQLYNTPKANNESAILHFAVIRQRLINNLQASFTQKIVALFTDVFKEIPVETLRLARNPSVQSKAVEEFVIRESAYWSRYRNTFLQKIEQEGWELLQNDDLLQEEGPIQVSPLEEMIAPDPDVVRLASSAFYGEQPGSEYLSSLAVPEDQPQSEAGCL